MLTKARLREDRERCDEIVKFGQRVRSGTYDGLWLRETVSSYAAELEQVWGVLGKLIEVMHPMTILTSHGREDLGIPPSREMRSWTVDDAYRNRFDEARTYLAQIEEK